MTWKPKANKRGRYVRSAAGAGLVARLGAAPTADELAALWQEVEAAADGSVFQSWMWLGCRFAARFDRPMVLTIEDGARVLAIGLLNRGGRRFGAARAFLGETGRRDEDSVFIEHNGPLVVRDRPEARDAWWAALLRARYGLGLVVQLSGIGEDDAAAARRSGMVGRRLARVAPRRHLVAGIDCLAAVSANTRQQINRAWRRYERSGAILVERAETTDQALAWLDRLAALHKATWESRGKPGAFAGPAFRLFHAELVGRGTDAGAVDLLRITAGARVIGYLYSFVWRGAVSAYQSGFAYDGAHPHEKPGLVCHAAAMRHYQGRGMAIYDFLAGDDRYKTSLADGQLALHWTAAAARGTLAGAILAVQARIASGPT